MLLASTGLNERIAPEDITRLAQSGERVFRATFDSEPPAALYWRVLVHEWFDGHTWNVSPTLASWFSAAKTAGSRVAGRIQPPCWQGTPSTMNCCRIPITSTGSSRWSAWSPTVTNW